MYRGLKLLTIVAKYFILDVCGGPGYASDVLTLQQCGLERSKVKCEIDSQRLLKFR